LKRRKLLPGLVTLRLDDATIARIDAQIPMLSTPARDAIRSEALRMIISVGMDCVERDFADAIQERSARAKTPEA
jgi:hypothetical protein